jgi:hypothetical protein
VRRAVDPCCGAFCTPTNVLVGISSLCWYCDRTVVRRAVASSLLVRAAPPCTLCGYSDTVCYGVMLLLCDVMSPPTSWCVLHPHARCVGIRTLCVTVSCCCCATCCRLLSPGACCTPMHVVWVSDTVCYGAQCRRCCVICCHPFRCMLHRCTISIVWTFSTPLLSAASCCAPWCLFKNIWWKFCVSLGVLWWRICVSPGVLLVGPHAS